MRTFKKGQKVYWHDPAGETSGKYKVLDTYPERNAEVTHDDIADFDDRMILIGNGSSEADVHAQELDIIETKVVFRKWRKDGDVIALFPDEIWNEAQKLIASYQHIGQHSGAEYHTVISRTKPAKPGEYAGLLTELESIGYQNLRVMKRCHPKFN